MTPLPELIKSMISDSNMSDREKSITQEAFELSRQCTRIFEGHRRVSILNALDLLKEFYSQKEEK